MGYIHVVTDSETNYAAQLRGAGLQVTAQRLAVLEAVCLHPHSAADVIWRSTQEKLGAISRQAVFDALNVMTEAHLITRIQPAGAAARYEREVQGHPHIVCRQCGAVADAELDRPEGVRLRPRDAHGFVLQEAEVIFWGICPMCQEKQEPTSQPKNRKGE